MKTGKKKTHYIMPIMAAVLFAAAVIWFVSAMESAEQASHQQRLDTVRRSVENAVTLCYSIEGAYPESMEYLIDSYGLRYDKDDYIVHYECFAANIRPQITVIEKEGAHE